MLEEVISKKKSTREENGYHRDVQETTSNSQKTIRKK